MQRGRGKRIALAVLKCVLLLAVCTGAFILLPVLYGKNDLRRVEAIEKVQEEQRLLEEERAREAERLRMEQQRAEEEARKAAEQAEKRPDVDIDSWEFILANPDNSVKEYAPKTAPVEGVELDERIVPAMQEFLEAARSEGLWVVLASGYRSYEEQQYLFQEKVAQYGDEDVAATIVARPGTSEHQTGLAADITDQYYDIKKQSLEETELYQWMSAHCQDFGFIVRYPQDKEDITGIIYEPWHFRYVGKEAAAYIMENSLTLEEFLELYREKGSGA